MKTFRIASCPQPSVNPYFALYYGALARFGVEVEYVRNVMQTPIVGATGRAFDAVQFHWSVERNWRFFGRRTIPQLYGLVRWKLFLQRARKSGVKIIWTAHELAPPEGGTWIDDIGYRMCGQGADLIICHSELCRRELIDRFQIAETKAIAIPHGTYDGVLVPTQSREATCRQWGLPTDRHLLLCFGFQRPRKGLEVALQAMRQLGNEFHLVVQASTSTSRLKKWLAGVRDTYRDLSNVSFLHEEIDNGSLANLLVAADCAILPYLEIVGSGALCACLTVGRGAIVSDLPYFRESLARDPEVAVFFPPGDASGLASAVTKFFSTDLSKRQAAARRLADRLQWDDLVTPIGEWLQAHAEAPAIDLSAAERQPNERLTRA